MPVIPSGNISLLELIDLAFEQKHGNAAVAPLELDRVLDVSPKWDAVHKAVEKAVKAHDIMLYVESLDGTEKRLTDQQPDESPVWRTLLTGKLEHEPDPAVSQRTVYVRDDDAYTFLKEFTGKEIEQPDTTTGAGDEEKAAELAELRQDEARPPDKQPSNGDDDNAAVPRKTKKEQKVLRSPVGRKKGQSPYARSDKLLAKEMHKLVGNDEEEASVLSAAQQFAPQAKGAGTLASKADRLRKTYRKEYPLKEL